MSILKAIRSLFHSDVSGRSGTVPSTAQSAKDDYKRSVERHNTACVANRVAIAELSKAIAEHHASRQEMESCLGLCGHSCPYTACPLHEFAQKQSRRHSEECPLLIAHVIHVRTLMA